MMKFMKFLGGVILAIIGFLGMLFAILGFFIVKISEVLQGTPLADWPLIVIGVVGFIAFIGGVYVLRSDP
jgi:hypothetical protein